MAGHQGAGSLCTAEERVVMAQAKIDRVTLCQVGPFTNAEIVFGIKQDPAKANVHLLTGPNGCGKSTVLFALAEVFRNLKVFGTLRQRFRAPDSSVHFIFDGQPGHYGIFSGTAPPEGAYGSAKNLMLDTSYHNFFFYGQGKSQLSDYKEQQDKDVSLNKFSMAAFAYSGLRSLEVAPLTAIEAVVASPFAHGLDFQQSVRPNVLLQWIANNRTQWALATTEGDQAAAQSYDRSLGRITAFIREVCQLEVEFRLERSPLHVVLRVEREIVPLNVLPDGLKSILSWVGDLVLRLDAIPWAEPGDVFAQPVFLFLDEIDIHLHPKWQRLILPAVQKLLPNSEVFASTHSPFVVASVYDAWVYRLPSPGTEFRLEAEPSGAGKSYSVILKEIFSVEEEFDPETEDLFDRFYLARDLALKNQGQDLEPFQQLANQLAERGEEARAIVSSELRQLSKHIGKDCWLN